MRVSGKHNDFKEVGYSPRHHTFFEMLGNFSFGDYFKTEATRFAWDLVTRELGLDPDRLWITVFRDDDEAWEIWHKKVGIPADRIVRLGEKDNFWAMGETGPCGPCSEIHYDFGQSPRADHPECDLTCSCGRWVEIWNLVFMQFNRDLTGAMSPLPSPSIDTGMGFERIVTILQGKFSNYDNDLFQPLLKEIAQTCNLEYGAKSSDDVSMRIIADHSRAAAFVIADGQYPGNDKRGYVLRKIMRRAMVHGKRLGIEGPFIFRIAGVVVTVMKQAYPELLINRETIARVIKQEEEAFAETLGQGLRDFYDRAKKIKQTDSRTLSGEEAFFLYDTRGLPLEILEELAQEAGLLVDEAGFNRALEQQRARSRQDYQTGKAYEQLAGDIPQEKTRFEGYGCTGPLSAKIQALYLEGRSVPSLEVGTTGEVILDITPFYAEAGGQVADTGELRSQSGSARIVNTQYRGTVISHTAEILNGSLQVGEPVEAVVDLDRRRLTMKNHTATHLLHAALKKIVGPHVKQAGSLVTPDRLRFDFTHFSPLTSAEIQKLEAEVNEWIWRNVTVDTKVMQLDQALETGAVALFGEKYHDDVRVVEVPGFSKELCGGTHVPATGTIGIFKILSQESVAAGVRRLEGVTGPGAYERFRADEELFDSIQSRHKIGRHEILSTFEKLQTQIKDLQRQVAELQVRTARSQMDQTLGDVREISGVKVLARQVPEMDRGSLRGLAEELKQKLGSGVVILGNPQDGKVALVVMVSQDLSKRIPAGKIIKEIAPLIGGSGGGKPELAEAGGKEISKLADALQASYTVVRDILGP
jgi:alanyl-tRNA synthetase